MKNKKISIAGICILFAFFWRVQVVCAREFVHPGGLHTRADLERMKKMVAEGRQPWLEGWKELEKDPLAQAVADGEYGRKSAKSFYRRSCGLFECHTVVCVRR